MLYHQPLDRDQTVVRAVDSAHIRRLAAERKSRRQNPYMGEDVIQAQTKIQYTPGTYEYNYDNTTKKYRNSVTVGQKMCAELDPKDPQQGTSAGSAKNVHEDLMDYLRGKWGTLMVRGHLLNDYLGGPAVEENLFPISKAANAEHLGKVEGLVKHYTYLVSKEKPDMIYYQVVVKNSDNSLVFEEKKPQSKFECSLKVIYAPTTVSAGQTLTPAPYCYNYTVESDLSKGTSGGSAEHVQDYTGNIREEWNPVNIRPQRIPNSTGSMYTLYGGTKYGNLGTVTHGLGVYQKSVRRKTLARKGNGKKKVK